MKFFIISYVNSLEPGNSLLERRKHAAVWFSCFSKTFSVYPHIIIVLFIYSVTYSVKCLHMCKIICGRKSTCMTQTKRLTKTTQIWGFSKLCVKIKKKSVIPTYSIFQHAYSKHNLVSFYAESYFDSRIASSFFILFLGGVFRRKR